MTDFLKSILPLKIIEKAVLIEKSGFGDLFWEKENALLVIQHLIEQDKIILGGDVYKIEDKKILPTCDSWFYQINLQKSLKINVHESAFVATRFINNYFDRNGDSYCYAIVIKE